MTTHGTQLRTCTAALALSLVLGCPEEPVPLEPDVTVSSEELNFGQVTVGYPATRTVEVANDGDGVLIVSSVTTSSPGFTLETPLPDLNGIGPGEGSWISVTFSPAHDGTVIGSLVIHSDDPDTPEKRVSFVGQGITPEVALSPPDEIHFGASLEGDVQRATATVLSAGTAPLQLYAVQLGVGADAFWIEAIEPGPPATLDPGDEAVVHLAYSALVNEEASDTLLVLTDDPTHPLVELELRGDPANGAPLCSILAPTQTSLLEGTEITLEASAVDGQDDPEELTASWTDQHEGSQDVICSPAPWSFGRFVCDYTPYGAGPHTLTFEAEDREGVTCAEQIVIHVEADDPPDATITAPADGHTASHGDCLVFSGEVGDTVDGDELEVEWWSDHPDAPAPLWAGWSGEDGATEWTACDLPCGEQSVSLHVLDSGGQGGVDAVTVTVSLLDPILDLVDDQEVVLGQELSLTFVAVESCGLEPTIQISGEPADATVSAEGLTYRPEFEPLDNPVGESFTVHVRAEVELDGDLREDELTFSLDVVSDEYLAVGGASPGPLEALQDLYDGSLGALEALSAPVDLLPLGLLDVNDDGAADLLAADSTQGAWILLRQADGSLDAQPLGLLVDGPVAVGDFDGDGLDDWLVLDPVGTGTTHLNRTDPLIPDVPLFDASPAGLDLALLGETGLLMVASSSADHDLDGLDDLVFAYTDDLGTSLYLALASGSGGLDAPQPWLATSPIGGLAAGVFGPDALPDVILGGPAIGDPGQAYLLTGDGLLGLGPPEEAWDANPIVESAAQTRPGASRVAPMDVDHDGCLDVVVVHETALGAGGEATDLRIGVAFQETDDFEGTCVGSFLGGSGNDPPEFVADLLPPATVVVPHAP